MSYVRIRVKLHCFLTSILLKIVLIVKKWREVAGILGESRIEQ